MSRNTDEAGSSENAVRAELFCALEIVLNLVYLARNSSTDAEKIEHYMDIADQQAHRIRRLLCLALPDVPAI